MRSVVVNVVGLVFIGWCLYSVTGHLHYLSKSGRPARSTISRELEGVIASFSGNKLSSVDIFGQKVGYISARVRLKRTVGSVSIDDGQKSRWRHLDGEKCTRPIEASCAFAKEISLQKLMCQSQTARTRLKSIGAMPTQFAT